MARFTPGVCVRWVIAPFVVWTLFVLRANVYFRLYPAVMAAGAFLAFALSLFRTPLAEVFARRTERELDTRAVVYCRRVTQIWTVFLAVHLLVSVATVFASHEVWAFYNGFLAYVLLGGLFFGERIFRWRFQRG